MDPRKRSRRVVRQITVWVLNKKLRTPPIGASTLTSSPLSSKHSRVAASAGCSWGSTAPPGRVQQSISASLPNSRRHSGVKDRNRHRRHCEQAMAYFLTNRFQIGRYWHRSISARVGAPKLHGAIDRSIEPEGAQTAIVPQGQSSSEQHRRSKKLLSLWWFGTVRSSKRTHSEFTNEVDHFILLGLRDLGEHRQRQNPALLAKSVRKLLGS
jgi:hypothetical protein